MQAWLNLYITSIVTVTVTVTVTIAITDIVIVQDNDHSNVLSEHKFTLKELSHQH